MPAARIMEWTRFAGLDLRDPVFSDRRGAREATNVWFTANRTPRRRPPYLTSDEPAAAAGTQGLLYADGEWFTIAGPGHAGGTVTWALPDTSTMAATVLKWSTDPWGETTIAADDWELIEAGIVGETAWALVRHTRTTPERIALHVWDGGASTLVQDPAAPCEWGTFMEPAAAASTTWAPRIMARDGRLWWSRPDGKLAFSAVGRPRVWNVRTADETYHDGEFYACSYETNVGEGRVRVEVAPSEVVWDHPTGQPTSFPFKYYGYIGEYWDTASSSWRCLDEVAAYGSLANTGTFFLDTAGSVLVCHFRKTGVAAFRLRLTAASPTGEATAIGHSGPGTTVTYDGNGSLEHWGTTFDLDAVTGVVADELHAVWSASTSTLGRTLETVAAGNDQPWAYADAMHLGSKRLSFPIIPYYFWTHPLPAVGVAPIEPEPLWHNTYTTERAPGLAGSGDAGWLDIDYEDQLGGGVVTTLASVRHRLLVATPHVALLYAVSANPAGIALLDRLPVGCRPAPAVEWDAEAIVAGTDQIRGLSLRGLEWDALRHDEVGAAVAPLGALDVRVATAWPRLGLVCLAYVDGDDRTRLLVLNLSRVRKQADWAVWESNDAAEAAPSAMVAVDDRLVLRRGDAVWVYDHAATAFKDTADGTGDPYESRIGLPFSNVGRSGERKSLLYYDVSQAGESILHIRPLPHLATVELTRVAVSTTHGVARIPLRGVYHGLAPVWVSRDDEGWELYRASLTFKGTSR